MYKLQLRSSFHGGYTVNCTVAGRNVDDALDRGRTYAKKCYGWVNKNEWDLSLCERLDTEVVV
jgi:hypothetical protein